MQVVGKQKCKKATKNNSLWPWDQLGCKGDRLIFSAFEAALQKSGGTCVDKSLLLAGDSVFLRFNSMLVLMKNVLFTTGQGVLKDEFCCSLKTFHSFTSDDFTVYDTINVGNNES